MLTSMASWGQSYHADHYLFSVGSARLQIDEIFEDHRGNIYCTSGHQVLMFDGKNFEAKFSIDSAVNFTSSTQVADYVYLGTSNGSILQFDQKSTEFSKPLPVSPTYKITGVVSSNSTSLYVSTYGAGLFTVTGFERVEPISTDGILDLYALALDRSENLCLGTDHGLVILSSGSHELKRIETSSNEIVSALHVSDDYLWIGTFDGDIYRWSEGKDDIELYSTAMDVGPIRAFETVGKNIWCLAGRSAIWSFNQQNGQVQRVRSNTQKAIPQNIQTLYTGHRQGVWLGSETESLTRINSKFQFYKPVGLGNMQMVLSLDEDEVLVGTQNGIFLYNAATNHAQQIDQSSGLNVICFQRVDDVVFIGTFDQGLYELNLKDRTIRKFDRFKAMKNNSIIALEFDGNQLWISTLGGIYRAEIKKNGGDPALGKLDQFSQISTNYVYDILAAQDGYIYFATDGDGLARYDGKEVAYFLKDSLSRVHLYSITDDHEGNIWGIQSDNTLCVLRPDAEHLDCGLHSVASEVSGLFRTDTNNLIIVYDNGLDIIDRKSMAAISYGSESGFEEFQPQLNALSSADDYQLVLASKDQLIIMSDVDRELSLPSIFFESIQVGDRNLQPNVRYDLSSDERTIVFEINAIYYENPNSITYRYKLEGHDADWLETRDQTIIYPNLQPGDYSFRATIKSSVFAQNSTNEAIFEFSIPPPWWQRPWVIALLAMLLIVGFYVITKWREQKIRSEKESERLNLERQYATLKNQLNPHFLFNAFNTLISYIEEDPKTAVHVVEHLSDFYRRILEVKDNRVVSIKQELNLLNDYVYLLNKRFNDNLKMDIDIQSTQHFIPPMTLQLLVENAVKHNVLSDRYPLHVYIQEKDGVLIVSNVLKLKRSESPSTGIGLKNIKKRFELLGAPEVLVKRDEHTFKVIIPILNTNML